MDMGKDEEREKRNDNGGIGDSYSAVCPEPRWQASFYEDVPG
jgi:hypothetical protein